MPVCVYVCTYERLGPSVCTSVSLCCICSCVSVGWDVEASSSKWKIDPLSSLASNVYFQLKLFPEIHRPNEDRF